MANAKRQTKTGRAPKNDGEGLKNDGKGLKNDGVAPKKPGAWWETLSPEEIVARLEQKKDPEPPQVELVAPPRRNRSVDDVSAFVETARQRGEIASACNPVSMRRGEDYGAHRFA